MNKLIVSCRGFVLRNQECTYNQKLWLEKRQNATCRSKIALMSYHRESRPIADFDTKRSRYCIVQICHSFFSLQNLQCHTYSYTRVAISFKFD